MLQSAIKLYTYRRQVVQTLQVEDYDARVEMCESFPYHYQNDPQLLLNLEFSNGSVFHLSGRVNRHNCRIWGKSNPAEILQHERDSPKLVVWCAMSSTELMGPFFFHDASGTTTTVTGNNYLEMLQEL